MRTHLFRRLPENLARTALDVDSGQLAVAVLPLSSLAAKGEEWVRSCCHVLPIHAGESVGVEHNEDTVQHIAVTHGSDLTVPEDAEGWVLVAGDPCYFLDGEYGTDDDYGRACRVSCGNGGENDDEEVEGFGFFDLNGGGRAFVSRTVYGDGTYPVRVRPGGFDLTLEHEREEEDEEEEEDDDFDSWADDADEDEDEGEDDE